MFLCNVHRNRIEYQWGRSGMVTKFVLMDGDGEKYPSHAALYSEVYDHIYAHVAQANSAFHPSGAGKRVARSESLPENIAG